jgi:hypothetical protein
MPSIDEQAGVSAEQLADKLGADAAPEAETGVGSGWKLPDWLFIERLDEPVEKYMSHALNFKKSEGWAYILRGLSALVGGILNYWWTDVIGGAMRLRKEAKEDDGSQLHGQTSSL